MLTTVELSPYIFAQGKLAAALPDGSVTVEVNGRRVIGRPVTRKSDTGAATQPVRVLAEAEI